jgi:putative FmdB family regulatory protein
VPTYEYACTSCGHRLEAVQSFTDDPLTECPECGGPLRKVYGAVGIVLKGSGFYKTDSRTAAASNGRSSTSNGDGGDAKGSDGGESKSSGDSASKESAGAGSQSGDAKSGDAKASASSTGSGSGSGSN